MSALQHRPAQVLLRTRPRIGALVRERVLDPHVLVWEHARYRGVSNGPFCSFPHLFFPRSLTVG